VNDQLEDLERELGPALQRALHRAAARIIDDFGGDADTAVASSDVVAPVVALPTVTTTTRHPWRTIVGVAAAVALIAVGVTIGVRQDDPPAPQVSAAARARAEETAREFVGAVGEYDADRALTMLSPRAVKSEWGSPDVFRLELELMEASGWKQMVHDCDASAVVELSSPSGRLEVKPRVKSAAGVTVYCTYDYFALRSDELGRPRYENAYWVLVVKQGRIVSAENRISRTSFDDGNFHGWIQSAYPDDATAMYEAKTSVWKRSAESVRLWDAHTREYVAAGVPYVARANAICTAAHERLKNTVGTAPEEPFGSERSRAYYAAATHILQETLVELRAVPPPEPFRVEFEAAYRLGDAMVSSLLSLSHGYTDSGYSDARHGLGANPALAECTFDLPG
jgi:hypothetical protein